MFLKGPVLENVYKMSTSLQLKASKTKGLCILGRSDFGDLPSFVLDGVALP